MATTNTEQQLASLRDRAAGLSGLVSSGSDYQGATDPTRPEIRADVRQNALTNQIEAMKTKALKEQWYGNKPADASATAPGENQGPISKLLGVLPMGLYGVVGGIKGALGMGKNPGILNNVVENMYQDKQTAGDLMRQAGVPGWIAAPTGFMADIGLDPLTWATVGTASLIPKVGYGLVKGTMEEGLMGGVEAAARGGAVRIGQMGMNAADWISKIPYANKILSPEAMESIGNKILGQEKIYQELIGTKAAAEVPTGTLEGIAREKSLALKEGREPVFKMDTVPEGLVGKSIAQKFSSYAPGPGDIAQGVETWIRNTIPGGNKFMDLFKYSPLDYAEAQRVIASMPDLRRDLAGLKEGESVKSILDKYHSDFVKLDVNPTTLPVNLESEAQKFSESLDNIFNDGSNVVEFGGKRYTYDLSEEGLKEAMGPEIYAKYQAGNPEAADVANTIAVAKTQTEMETEMNKLSGETIDRISNVIDRTRAQQEGKTGVQWYDKLTGAIKEKVSGIKLSPTEIRTDKPEELLKAMEDAHAAGKIPDDVWEQYQAAKLDRIKVLEAQARQSMGTWSNEDADLIANLYTNWDESPLAAMKKFEDEFAAGHMTFGQKIVGFFNGMDSWFRMSKVASSPVAIVNSVLGNSAMIFAAGIDPSPGLLTSIRNAYLVSYNKAGPDVIYNFLLSNPEFITKVLNHDGYFRATVGVGAESLAADFLAGSSVYMANKAGFLSQAEMRPVMERFGEVIDEFRAKGNQLMTAKEAAATGVTGVFGKAVQTKKEQEVAARGAELFRETIEKGLALRQKESVASNLLAPGSPIAQESGALTNNAYLGFKDWVKRTSVSGTGIDKLVARVMNFGVNKMARVFESSDQIFKLGLTMHCANNGLTEKELQVASRFMLKGVKPEDEAATIKDMITSTYTDAKTATKHYRISLDKSLDFANEVLMNYAAMPSAVRVLRSAALIGAPFVSFQYAILSKFGKTLVHNPEFFNKLTYAFHEMSGGKGPVERDALKNNAYFQWYNSPGMLRLPDFAFFKNNPMYLNLANIIPFYSMSITGESQRGFSDSALGQTAGFLDKLPLFQTPIGQVLKDYFFLPMVFQAEGLQPKGQFGQQLYPINATLGQKVGSAMSTLAGAYVPQMAGVAAGVVAPSEIGTTDIAQHYPYMMGKISFAKSSKSPLGIQKTETGALPGTFGKALLGSLAGMNLYEINRKAIEKTAGKKVVIK